MSVDLKRVLISDPVDEKCADLLKQYGIHVTTKYKLAKDDLIAELQNHDGLIVRSETKVTSEVISRAPKLKLIGRAGAGVDTIDVESATRHGIVVLNTPGGNSISACELTCALISALARNVVQAGAALKDKRWDRKLYAGTELYGKTLGVLGFGNIGRLVTRRMQSFGMNVLAYDPFLNEKVSKEYNVTKAELSEIWPRADYITVHTPLIPQTRNLINAETLAKCKKGVRIINVARGGIVDEEALLNSIKSGHCGGAAIDVFVDEPPKRDVTWELIQHPKVICTPHLGASTAEAQQRVAVEIAEQFLVLSGKSNEYAVTGVVNAPALAAAVSVENMAWVDLSKKLGQIGNRFLAKEPKAIVESATVGDDLKSKQFIHTAVVLGLLATSMRKNDVQLNLVNAKSSAKNEGLNVKETHLNGKSPAVVIKVGSHEVTGTVRGNSATLLSINETSLGHGVTITDFVSLYKINTPEDLEKIVKAFLAKGVRVNSLNVCENWVLVQTSIESFVNIPSLECF